MKSMPWLFASMFTFSSFATVTRTGEWIEGRSQDFRYVTTYETKKVIRPFQGFPQIEQDCHDEGQRFASWAKSVSYEIVYGGGLNFSLLGFVELDLGAERSKTVEFTFQRWVIPTKGLRARHTLMEDYEVWSGVTEVEFRNSDGTIKKGTKTYAFNLTRMNYGISVDREIIEVCERF